MEVRKKSKKVKKTKTPKKSNESSTTLKLETMEQKRKEISRVLLLKQEILMRKEVSYLEYLEIRAQIERLNALKQTYLGVVKKLKQQAN